MPQIAVRLSAAELEELDAAIASGLVRSRAEGVRLGLELLRRRHREDVIARDYVRAYRDAPLDDAEERWLDALRGHPAEVDLDQRHGVQAPSAANCDVIVNVRKEQLTRRRGELDPQTRRALDDALRVALELE